MTMEPFFNLSPRQPMYTTACPRENAPAVTAFVNFWNMAALAWGGSGGTKPTLATQLNEGWVYMSGGTAAPEDEDQDNLICNRERSQVVEIGFQGVNVSERNQFLIVMGLHALGESAAVRIALYRNILRTDRLRPGDNTLAIVID